MASEFVPGLLLPPGRIVHLPGRGDVFVREIEGPPEAPAVVLLHGLMLTADLNWFAAYRPLARSFRVVALDQRGHGRGLRPRTFSLADCADDVAALLAVLDLPPAVVVGYSMGGAVAQELWRRHPHLVAGMVLCATASSFRSPVPFLGPVASGAWSSWWLSLPGTIDHLRHVLTGPARDPALRRWIEMEKDRTAIALIRSAVVEVGRYRSAGWVSDLDVPSAVIVPDDDRVVPVRDQVALAEAAGARVFRTGGGHDCPLTRPDTFVSSLVDACRDVARRILPAVDVVDRPHRPARATEKPR